MPDENKATLELFSFRFWKMMKSRANQELFRNLKKGIW